MIVWEWKVSSTILSLKCGNLTLKCVNDILKKQGELWWALMMVAPEGRPMDSMGSCWGSGRSNEYHLLSSFELRINSKKDLEVWCNEHQNNSFTINKGVWRLWDRHEGWMHGWGILQNKLNPKLRASSTGLINRKSPECTLLQEAGPEEFLPPADQSAQPLLFPLRRKRRWWGWMPGVLLHGYLLTLKYEEWDKYHHCSSRMFLSTLKGHSCRPWPLSDGTAVRGLRLREIHEKHLKRVWWVAASSPSSLSHSSLPEPLDHTGMDFDWQT